MGAEVTKNDVLKLIEIKKTDTLFTHLSCFIFEKSIAMGEIGAQKIKIWRPNYWNRAYYPIFEFEFNSENHLIKISDRINPASKIYFSILAVFFFSVFISPIYPDFYFPKTLYYVLFVFSFLMLIFYVFYKFYHFEKNNQLEQIFEILDIEIEKKMQSGEWSFKSVLTRVLLYPFSIGMLLLSVLYMIPNGYIFQAIGCFIFFGSYLFVDLKILFSKKKK